MFCFVPVQTWFYHRDRQRNGGVGRPEARFITSLVGVWGFPISLLWFAFTCDGSVSFWSPVVAGGLLGVVDPLLWLSMLNYIADTYTNVAASAIAAFLIPSFVFAAGCCHIGTLAPPRRSADEHANIPNQALSCLRTSEPSGPWPSSVSSRLVSSPWYMFSTSLVNVFGLGLNWPRSRKL